MANLNDIENEIDFMYIDIDIDDEIEIVNDLFNEDVVPDDCVVLEEDLCQINYIGEEDAPIIKIPNIVHLDKENILVVVESDRSNFHSNPQSNKSNAMLSSSTCPYICKYCQKNYKTQKCYEKHLEICKTEK